MSQNENPETIKSLEALQQQAWNYFNLHADHRLRAFNFYILLSTALVSGFAIALGKSGIGPWFSVFGIFLIFFSFVFWKMDNRTKGLLKTAESALKYAESECRLQDIDGRPHPLTLFTREEFDTSLLPLYPLSSGHFSYARCFRWIFSMFALAGIVIVVISLTH